MSTHSAPRHPPRRRRLPACLRLRPRSGTRPRLRRKCTNLRLRLSMSSRPHPLPCGNRRRRPPAVIREIADIAPTRTSDNVPAKIWCFERGTSLAGGSAFLAPLRSITERRDGLERVAAQCFSMRFRSVRQTVRAETSRHGTDRSGVASAPSGTGSGPAPAGAPAGGARLQCAPSPMELNRPRSGRTVPSLASATCLRRADVIAEQAQTRF